MTHTKEPWRIEESAEFGIHIVDADGLHVSPQDHSRRIVACVNALEGLSDYALLGGWSFRGIEEYASGILKERDHLRHEIDAMAVDLTVMMRDRDELLCAIRLARECIAEDRDSLYETHRNPVTDTVNDVFGLSAIADYDAVLDAIDAAISRAEAADKPESISAPKFAVTGCSQCGQEFGPGDHGYSHCENHRGVSGK